MALRAVRPTVAASPMNEPENIFDAFRSAKDLPERKQLGHTPPAESSAGSIFFVTINCQQRGRNQLCQPKIANILLEAVRFNHGTEKWYANLFLLMPDHVHALLGFPIDQNMERVVSDWKRFTARTAKVEWQRDFFDHRLRHDESYAQKAEYIRQNPVRMGLIERAEDWPYVTENRPW